MLPFASLYFEKCLQWSPVSVPHKVGTPGAKPTENVSVAHFVRKETAFPPFTPSLIPPIFLRWSVDVVVVDGPVMINVSKSNRIWKNVENWHEKWYIFYHILWREYRIKFLYLLDIHLVPCIWLKYILQKQAMCSVYGKREKFQSKGDNLSDIIKIKWYLTYLKVA